LPQLLELGLQCTVVKKLLREVIVWLVEVKNTIGNYVRRELKRKKQWL
jgi:hypothetical protein